MLKSKKLLGILLVFTLAFSLLGGTALAADHPDPNLGGSAVPPTSDQDCATYLATEPAPAESISVTLVIEAGDAIFQFGGAFREEFTETLTSATPERFTVTDLLDEIDNDPANGFTFYSTNGSSFTGSSDYLEAVDYDGYSWENGSLGFDGWVFRVNDRMPVEANGLGGYWGTTILDTYIEDGDVIHFFYDFPSDLDDESGSLAAGYVRAVQLPGGTIQLQSHTTYIEPLYPYSMSVDNYSDLGSGITVGLYDADGDPVASESSDGSGRVDFTGVDPGTYILKTDSVPYETDDPFWGEYVNGVYFTLTGAYDIIVIP